MAQQRRVSEATTPEDDFEVGEVVADIYCDSLHISTGLYSSTLYLGVSQPGKKDKLLARVRVSPQMLRAISLLAGKHVKEYQEAVGPINLPAQMVRNWGLEEGTK